MSRKRKERKRRDKGADEEGFGNFSWWTPWRKFVGIAALVGCLGGTASGLYHCGRDDRRREAYRARVAQIISDYEGLPSHKNAVDACLTPGSEAGVFTDSAVVRSAYSESSVFTVSEGARKGAGLCIRPVDGDQDVGLESRVLISGMDYGDLEGTLQYRIGLKLVPDIPDIFPHRFSVRSISIGQKSVPVSYLEERDEGVGDHLYLDLNRLVFDGVLDAGDFDGDLDVLIGSELSIDGIPDIPRGSVVGISAYDGMSGLQQYLSATDDFPVDDGSIREIVDSYEGSTDNVVDVVGYVLDHVNDTLEYCYADGSNCKGGRWLHVLEAMERGSGVCQAYSEMFVTLCRAFGIPSRYVANHTLTSSGDSISGRHAWAEVLIPFDDGSRRWVLVEPTWSDDEDDPHSYINFVDSRHMYDLGFHVELDTLKMHDRYDIFQEHRWMSEGRGEGAAGDVGGQSSEDAYEEGMTFFEVRYVP